MKYFKRNLDIVIVSGKPLSICHKQTNIKYKYIILMYKLLSCHVPMVVCIPAYRKKWFRISPIKFF